MRSESSVVSVCVFGAAVFVLGISLREGYRDGPVVQHRASQASALLPDRVQSNVFKGEIGREAAL